MLKERFDEPVSLETVSIETRQTISVGTIPNETVSTGTGQAGLKIETTIPARRYLNREEAAAWLGMSVDTFNTLDIPYCDFGPRTKRWDVLDIVTYANDTKQCDSARTSDMRRRQRCDSTSATTRPNGGRHGTKTESDIAEVLGLTTGS
ncbi:MAG: hypothetical protein JJ900_13205 [Rhodospirillales bacterium]|nr:hypothetical protein [Rhodospirillales bacterium]MBO6787803.1 hypothetical protein [Rhodospirillales bacterium]